MYEKVRLAVTGSALELYAGGKLVQKKQIKNFKSWAPKPKEMEFTVGNLAPSTRSGAVLLALPWGSDEFRHDSCSVVAVD